uniref:Uncharacterized protein n=1 Tax=Rhizophora mucronata TaxID=61149 RepID=A0A2P2J055_RHIMU
MLFLPASVATPLESLVGTLVAMKKTIRSHWSCNVAIQCLAPKARPLLMIVRYIV